MHTAALHACNLVGTYEIRDLTPADVPAFVRELRDGAYTGCNVTIPYKATLANACDRLDDDARLIGAVNTIEVDGDGQT